LRHNTYRPQPASCLCLLLLLLLVLLLLLLLLRLLLSLLYSGCRHVLNLPVRNSTRVDLIEFDAELEGFRVTVSSSSSTVGGQQQQQEQQQQESEVLFARKVVLATGIQVGGDAGSSGVRWGRSGQEGVEGAKEERSSARQGGEWKARKRGHEVAVVQGGVEDWETRGGEGRRNEIRVTGPR